MIRRNTWILLGAFIVVLAAGIYLQRSGGLKPAEGTATPAVAEERPLLDIQAESIRTLKIEDAQGQVVSLERQSDGTSWKLLEPQSEAADNNQVDPVVISLAGLTVLNPLETTLDLGVIGLEPAADSITIGLSDGGQHVLLIGAATPTGTGYYARLDGGAPVVVSKFSIDSALELLVNPPISAIATSPPETGTPGVVQTTGTQETRGLDATETATITP